MELMLLRVFQKQVELQCRAISSAARDIDAAIARLNEREIDAMSDVWIGVQNLLNAAANVSKACWGQRGRYTAERQQLRDSLNISDASPLTEVTMRNHFEHYDERLDDWWKTSEAHNHADMNIGTITGLDPKDSFRALDPKTMEAIFWGERFDLRSIVAEAERILPIATAEASKPHWGP